MLLDVDTLQQKYPNPGSAQEGNEKRASYCVGGCLVLELGGSDGFPRGDTLRDYLLDANPALDPMEAMDYARGIIDANDDGRFSDAWNNLHEALAYPQEP